MILVTIGISDMHALAHGINPLRLGDSDNVWQALALRRLDPSGEGRGYINSVTILISDHRGYGSPPLRGRRSKSNVQTKKNPGSHMAYRGLSLITSLTITYFHTGCSTIIGVSSFHGPVRDGKGWYRVTMVIRHNLYKWSFPIGQRHFESGRSDDEIVVPAKAGI